MRPELGRLGGTTALAGFKPFRSLELCSALSKYDFCSENIFNVTSSVKSLGRVQLQATHLPSPRGTMATTQHCVSGVNPAPPKSLTGSKLRCVVLYPRQVQVVVSPLDVLIHTMVVAARLLQVAVTLEPVTKKKSMSSRKAQALKSSGKPRGQTRGSSLLLGTWEKRVPQKPLSLCLLFPVPTPICPISPCCTEGTPAPPSPRQPGAFHPAHCPPSSALDARSFPCSHRGLSFARRALWQQM